MVEVRPFEVETTVTDVTTFDDTDDLLGDGLISLTPRGEYLNVRSQVVSFSKLFAPLCAHLLNECSQHMFQLSFSDLRGRWGKHVEEALSSAVAYIVALLVLLL